PAAGVPDNVAVPSPLFTNVTPVGSGALLVIVVTVGNAVVCTVKLPNAPTANVAPAALVKIGVGELLTVSTKLCVVDPAPLVAVIVSGYVPPVPATGVPTSVATPLPVSVNVTPVGRAPLIVSDAAGCPEVEMRNRLEAAPITNVALSAVVNAGATGDGVTGPGLTGGAAPG